MGDPDSAIDCANADRTVTLGQKLAGRTAEALLLMRSIEEATFAEQRAENAGSTVRRADLPHDHGRIVPPPIDGAVGLPHRRAQTATHIGRHISKLFWLPSAGLERARFDSGDRLENAAHGGLGDLTTIEAALRGRVFLDRKLM